MYITKVPMVTLAIGIWLTFAPLTVRDAAAQLACSCPPPAGSLIDNNYNVSLGPKPGNGCNNPPGSATWQAPCYCAGTGYFCTPATPAPEMPGYLAAAFVVVAAGMIYLLRRRSIA